MCNNQKALLMAMAFNEVINKNIVYTNEQAVWVVYP